MKCLTGFMRKECERRRSSEIGIVDKGKDLGAMADAVAAAVKRAKRAGVLVDFLNKYATELTI